MSKDKFECGGIFSDTTENMICAFASPLTICIAIYVELMVGFKVINICITKGINNIWSKVNRETKYLLFNIHFSITHIYRECNKYVDYLIRMGVDLTKTLLY